MQKKTISNAKKGKQTIMQKKRKQTVMEKIEIHNNEKKEKQTIMNKKYRIMIRKRNNQ